MNYIEAVKELVNNPKAEAITFPSRTFGTRRIELRQRLYTSGMYTYLVFPAIGTKKQQNVVATSPDFLLREDFTVVYKEEKKYTESQIAEAFENGTVQGFEKAKRELKAYNEFKAAMKIIFGD